MAIPIIGGILASLNFTSIMLIFIALALGIFVGIFVLGTMGVKNYILYLREKDGRGLELPIETETDKKLETRSKPPLRFFKWGRGYNIVKGFLKRTITVFLAKEGTGYSWTVKGFTKVPTKTETRTKTIKNAETGEDETIEELVILEWGPEKIEDMDVGSLEDALLVIWGEEFYKTVPEERKAQLQDSTVKLSVELEPGITPEGFSPITESDINNEGDRNIMQLWAEEAKGALKTPIFESAMAMGFGGLIVLVGCLLMGWIKIAV